ncbi:MULTISPECIES: N-acetyl-D-Glu racemase DgcA [Kordiimonas]|jgi:L-alanine-DL-glutamate epimerase-like enolase superfamily enzyme|uniref:N-acetyl-D-Glu racemase DgcA n=1 Tax=Kordiimonas TaxID=288021 RepID=UPI00257FAE64|nr:N-acetyl-D-Glu racemase DgcA [Kordiimonas sp. UBA4487]
MEFSFTSEAWPIAGTFTISRGAKTEALVVTAAVSHKGHTGRGECVPYARYGETVESVLGALRSAAAHIMSPHDHHKLPALLPAGAARNALDCALWDLRAKLSGTRVWDLIGMAAPEPATTAFTLSVAPPDEMFAKAKANSDRPLLKLKLAGDGDLDRVWAVREGAPDAAIIVDANEGWRREHYHALVPELQRLGVAAIEQPFPVDDDDMLASLDRPIPVIADESCHTADDIPRLSALYDGVNIKLDKSGGLTEALKVREAAMNAGLQIMVGCMVGTSLAMAPAMLLTAGATFVDLDGPLLLARDRAPGLEFSGSVIGIPSAALWG